MVSDCFEFARKDRQAMSRTVAQSFESGYLQGSLETGRRSSYTGGSHDSWQSVGRNR